MIKNIIINVLEKGRSVVTLFTIFTWISYVYKIPTLVSFIYFTKLEVSGR